MNLKLSHIMDEQLLLFDIETTLKNRKALFKKKNLLYWYQQLYERLLGCDRENVANLRILEIGSGMSPLKHFYPSVITSDIMSLDHVDHVFDAHDIGCVSVVKNESLDLIILTNVLHHLRNPLDFLADAGRKLQTGGRIIMVEPYFSTLSRSIYLHLHHEPTDFSTVEPRLSEVKGPLSSANMAIPYMIFWEKPGWLRQVLENYMITESKKFYYSGISYMATGGISHNIKIPHWLYKQLWKLDNWLADSFFRQFAAFFCITLTKK
ncbi:MAG: methyltransferase domain-containing protein [Deltaproteobacteria bacterium]|nr:methyltransferase domain-containing protein [Deltaproteobacteria bacterium]